MFAMTVEKADGGEGRWWRRQPLEEGERGDQSGTKRVVIRPKGKEGRRRAKTG
jgi:hypothetical protein